jgi:hypothetical protein
MHFELLFTGSAADTVALLLSLASAHNCSLLCHLATTSQWPHQQPAAGEGWRGTSLEPYIEAFGSCFLAPLAASSKAALNERAQAAAAEQRTQRADMSW